MPTFLTMSHLEAPSARSTSSVSGSIVAMPVATFTTIGKNEIRKAVSTGGSQPTPNQDHQDRHHRDLRDGLKPTSSG